MFTGCDKLPLDIFIDCLLDNQLNLLIIEGAATPQELENNWNKIYTEYCQLSQQGSYNEVLELSRDINDINAKINIVNVIVKHLQLSFDQDLVNMLNSFALQCTITVEDQDLILVTKLNQVIARMKKWFTIITQKKRALEKVRSENTGKTDRAYFDEWLDIMSEQKGFYISADTITVSRFCRSMVKIREQAGRDEIKSMSKKK